MISSEMKVDLIKTKLNGYLNKYKKMQDEGLYIPTLDLGYCNGIKVALNLLEKNFHD